eukprot:172910_1
MEQGEIQQSTVNCCNINCQAPVIINESCYYCPTRTGAAGQHPQGYYFCNYCANLISANTKPSVINIENEPEHIKEVLRTVDKNGDGKIDVNEIVEIVKEKNKQQNKKRIYKKWILILLSISIILAAAGVIIGYAVGHEETQKAKSKSQAINDNVNVLTEVLNGSNITDYVNTLESTFKAFDTDGNGSWNIDEFGDYLSTILYDEDVFRIMDVDADNILSFREMVAYLTTLNTIPESSAWLQSSLVKTVGDAYNYYSTDANDNLLFQYGADLIFEYHNADNTGYITRDMYFEKRAEHALTNVDTNKNGVVDFNEFVELNRFQNETITFIQQNNILNVNFSKYADLLNIAESTVNSIDITICPSTTTRSARRTLGQKACDNLWLGTLFSGVAAIGCCATGVLCGGCISGADVLMGFTQSACGGPSNSILDEGNWCRYCASTGGGGSCFAASNEILISRDGSLHTVLLNQLQIGDNVFSKSGWTKVWYINAHKETDIMTNVYYIDQCNSSYDEINNYNHTKYISLTFDHLLYVNSMQNENMKRAEDVQIGDMIFTFHQQIGQETAFCQNKVINIDYSSDTSIFAITMDGSIVVSNVLASSYTKSFEHAEHLHKSTGILRWISHVNTKAAAAVANFLHNYVYEVFRYFDLESVFN